MFQVVLGGATSELLRVQAGRGAVFPSQKSSILFLPLLTFAISIPFSFIPPLFPHFYSDTCSRAAMCALPIPALGSQATNYCGGRIS